MPIEYYSPVSGGAVATILMQTARNLLAMGHQVSVLTGQDANEAYAVGKVIPLTIRKRGDLNLLQRRLSFLRGRHKGWDWPYYEYYLRSFSQALCNLTPAPDAVIVFNDLVSAPHIKAALPHTKVLVWLQNEQRTRQSAAQVKESAEVTHQFLTCSQYIKDWTAATHGIALEQITVAPSGVDLEAFYPRNGYLERGETLRTLFIGRIDPNKGPDIAADAVATLRAEGMSICLTVVGGLWFYNQGNEDSDPFFRTLKSKMASANASYVGHVTRHDVPELIRSHDVAFVLSRSNEPFGLVALEAMASGCAVIASERGGLPEACGGAASLVNPDDLQAVMSVLRSLAIDSDKLRACKQNSVVRATHAAWSETASKLRSAIKA